MKVYNTQKEIEADVVDGVLKIKGDVKINFNCALNADIKALDIEAYDIKAYDINALGIKALDIEAKNINAYDIEAVRINAADIKYYAFCIAYEVLKCTSIKGIRKNSIHKCLDNEIEIIT